MPEFIVIAGPNGAGKSSFSAMLSPVKAHIFDPDNERLKIFRSYPDIADEAIEDELTREYKRQEARAITDIENFTVETNFRNEFLADRGLYFKSNGYVTTVIFILLPSLATSIERVNLRVKRKGHYVDVESIKINFEMSWKTFKNTVANFDNVVLMAGLKSVGLIAPETLLVFKSGELIHLNEDVPKWAVEPVIEIRHLMGELPSKK